MIPITEGRHTGEHLISEAEGSRSREVGRLAKGQKLEAGTVIARSLHGAAYAVAAANTGNGTLSAITLGATAQVGDYTLRVLEAAVDAGRFELIDPQGDVVGEGTVGVEFIGGGLTFTLADGATDFVAGDAFTITVSAASSAADPDNVGNGTLSAVAVGASAAVGDYTLTITTSAVDGGEFSVTGPDGLSVGTGSVGVEFATGGLTFTLSDGAADFAVDDNFTITVAGELTALDLTASNGAQFAIGVLYDNVDATLASKLAVYHARDCEVNGGEITWPAAITADQKVTALRQLEGRGIFAR